MRRLRPMYVRMCGACVRVLVCAGVAVFCFRCCGLNSQLLLCESNGEVARRLRVCVCARREPRRACEEVAQGRRVFKDESGWRCGGAAHVSRRALPSSLTLC